MSMKTYYTLMVDWDHNGNWSPEFGDWDRSVVSQEEQDSYEYEKTKIVSSMEEYNEDDQL